MFTNFECDFISDTGNGPVVIYLTGPFARQETKNIYESVRQNIAGQDFILCEVLVDDWDNYLTPWKVETCVKDREFGGFGSCMLEEIMNKLLPFIDSKYPEREIYIAGYSLAGLFALWMAYETGIFNGVVSCSPSLWYPGWKEYIEQHRLNSGIRVYLSLGKKEEKTKNPTMKFVGDMVRMQYEILKNDSEKNITLEWNEGGHFTNTTERVARGVVSILSGVQGGK